MGKNTTADAMRGEPRPCPAGLAGQPESAERGSAVSHKDPQAFPEVSLLRPT